MLKFPTSEKQIFKNKKNCHKYLFLFIYTLCPFSLHPNDLILYWKSYVNPDTVVVINGHTFNFWQKYRKKIT